MVDKTLRGPKEHLLSPIARGPLRHVHPTALTVLAALLGAAAAAAAWRQAYLAALLLWALNRLIDGLDGTLARLQNKQSDLGAYLDIVLDTVVYALLPLGLALAANTPTGYLALALLIGSFYFNGATWMYLSALLEKRSQGAAAGGELTTVTMPGGLIEGAETVIFYFLFLLFPAAMVPLFLTMAALTIITGVQRVIWALGKL